MASIETLIKRQQGRCHYCKCELNRDPRSRNFATKDHKLPASAGGRRGRNLVAACWACNNGKGAMTHDEFVAYIAIHGRPNKNKPHQRGKLARTRRAE